jgi:hypothetical protein
MARQPVPNLPLICEETQTIVTATFAVRQALIRGDVKSQPVTHRRIRLIYSSIDSVVSPIVHLFLRL